MEFNILHDRVVVIPEPIEEARTSSGLFVADPTQNPIRFGRVTHVGTGRVSELSDKRITPDIFEGDRVFFPRAAGRQFTIDNVEYLLLTNEEIVGVEVND